MGGRQPYRNPGGDYLDMMLTDPSEDYGNGQPKRKKPYRADGDFLDMEHFHFKNFDTPSGERGSIGRRDSATVEAPSVNSKDYQLDCCFGINLPTVTECEDGWVNNEDDETLLIPLSVTVGGRRVQWEIESYGTEAGTLIGGAEAIGDETKCPSATAVYSIDKPFTNVLDLIKVKDLDTGCEDSVFISLGAECGDNCSEADCELPSIWCEEGDCANINTSSSKTYVLNDAQGNVTWAVSGTGASITQDGTLTTTAGACGTLTITATDGCCGDYTIGVRVADAGQWVSQESCTAGWTCSAVDHTFHHYVFSGVTRLDYTIICGLTCVCNRSEGCLGCLGVDLIPLNDPLPVISTCSPYDPYIVGVSLDTWECIP